MFNQFWKYLDVASSGELPQYSQLEQIVAGFTVVLLYGLAFAPVLIAFLLIIYVLMWYSIPLFAGACITYSIVKFLIRSKK